MVDLRLPSDGLTIVHDRSASDLSTSSNNTRQVIQINLLENITKDVLKSIRNSEQVRLRLGKKPTIQIGKKPINLDHSSDSFSSDLLVGSLHGSEPLYFSGRSSHILEVQKAKEATAKTDDALANLQNTLKSMQEHQASNEASFVRSKEDLKNANRKETRPASLASKDRFLGGSAPASPFLGPGLSPRLGPTSNPLLSGTPSKDKIRQDAIRIPVIHLLAMRPMTTKAIIDRLKAPKQDCERVLEKVARDGNAGAKELKEKYYRDLDVWKFPYQTQQDRQLAIDRAVHQYDRMRIDRHDSLWQSLLPKEDRGKGKTLSKLNFDKPIAAPKPAPANENNADAKADVSDREGKAKKVKTAIKEPKELSNKKSSNDTTTPKPKPVKAGGAAAKTTTKPMKQDGKFKSSERIEDSDEEAQAAPVLNAKPSKPAGAMKANTNESKRSSKVPPLRTKPTVHRQKVSNASSVSENSDKPASTTVNSNLKGRPRTANSAQKSKLSPRPGKDVSPQKRSPLGSSPPTNSTDLENSSKASSRSPAPSSPPSSTDVPIAKDRSMFSPVVTSKSGAPRNAAKRKAEQGDEFRSAKRQQTNGDHSHTSSKESTDRQQDSAIERRFSSSSLSSPEKHSINKQDVIKKAKEFTDWHTKYRKLHTSLSRQTTKEREDGKVEELWKMHKRLEEIKAEIWTDWDKITGSD